MADDGGGGGGGGLRRLDWTTWDELLLACAVERHGSKDWDLVAIELQARSSLPLTAQTCKGKFSDLNRRFMNDGNAVTRSHSSSIPWIEDLRRLRVAELQQEVHLHDLSIQKLQLKVKRLEEEEEERDKELKLRGDDNDDKPDLIDGSHVDASENNKTEDVGVLDEASPATALGDGSERENLSFNESNSSQNRSRENEPVEPNRVTSDSKPVGEDSSNDSSDTIAKHAPPPTLKPNRAEKIENSAATNSKKGNNNSSDVQSSASLSKKRRLVNEPIVSPATIKREAVKSEPLVVFLDVIRSHKHSSLFEQRRLDNQKTEEYKEIIRQHIDLETIRRKVATKSSSYYSSDGSKFYRDLLLLFTNYITFFPKSSKESLAALQLRTLVLKEISNKMTNLRKPGLSIDSDDTNATAQPNRPVKPNASLLTKNRPTSTPIVVCRKRSSISAGKSSGAAAAKDLKDDDSLVKAAVTGTRSLRKGIKSRAATKPPSPSEEKSPPSSPEPDRKKIKNTTTTSSSRKRGAADFLKRIKKNASPVKGSINNSSLLERLRSDDAANNKKSSGERRKELPKRGVVKQTKEESPPPKKKPAAGKSQPVRRGKEATTRSGAGGGGGGGGGSGVTTKRRRDEGDTEASNTAKKRTRR